MSKKIIRVTNKGILQSILGEGLPSSSEIRIESAMVSPPLVVEASSTGTVKGESFVVANSPCVVTLPGVATPGQSVTIAAVMGPIGVSASAPSFVITNTGPVGGFDLAAASASTCLRQFFYIDTGSEGIWVSGDNGGAGGVTGSYTF